MNFAIQEGSDGQYHRFRAEFEPHLGHGADNAIVFDNQIFNSLLEDHQIRLILQRGTHRLAV